MEVIYHHNCILWLEDSHRAHPPSRRGDDHEFQEVGSHWGPSEYLPTTVSVGIITGNGLSGHRSSCSYRNPLVFQRDYINWHPAFTPHLELVSTQVFFWFELLNCSWPKGKKWLCAPREVVRLGVCFTPWPNWWAEFGSFCLGPTHPFSLLSSEVTSPGKCKVKEGANSSSTFSVSAQQAMWWRIQRKYHQLIYHSPLISSHPSSALGCATRTDSNRVLSCQLILKGHWFPVA